MVGSDEGSSYGSFTVFSGSIYYWFPDLCIVIKISGGITKWYKMVQNGKKWYKRNEFTGGEKEVIGQT